ncbi:unnamed protein product [Brassica oleracea]
MMTRSHCYCFITIFFTLLLHTLASPPHHFCKQDQRDALLEFIAEFPTGESYTWNKSSDCCFWEGVTCNHRSGQVISLDLSYTLLNSSLKTNNSLFRLRSLRHLNLMDCNLRGEIPSSLGNLSRLVELDLWDNHLVGEVPVSVGNLNELRVLSLGGNKLSGNFPIIFANLTKLSFLGLNFNNFTSTLPVNMSEFINLEYFNINENSFFGPFPKSLFLNPLLESVDLGRNQFTGPFEFPNTSSLSSKLQFLNLANNRFDGPIPESISKFLHLSQIYLNHNNFSGSIPRSISNFANPSKDPLIQMLDLSSNSFQGPFPHWICKLKKLSLLDLSNNLFNGSIPPCLRNSTVSLIDLILRNNSFSGIIPDIFADATELQSFDVSRNHLEGSFPKSLIICKALQIVNVENNKIKDEFPFWLGSLPSLNVLILRSNEFYGPLYHPHMSIGFQSLKVIDVSHNEFTGTLPSHYFSNWREMTTSSEEIDQYYFASIGYTTPWNTYHTIYYESVYHSMEMVNKGVEMNFERILKDFRAINFSGNRISGEIPESISCLKELRLLNLSNNKFRNDIPRCISNLKNLETLDLSSNNLSGQIPQDLGNLSFLSYMNFSHNLLQGPVPRGTQFQRQKCSSFLDNPGLFGLEEICQQTHVPNPTSHQSEELSEAEEQVLNWIAAAIAYGPDTIMTRSHCFCFTTLYFFLLIHTLAFPPPHFCKQDQRDALLEFIGEFPTSEYTSWWDKSSDCCLWSGISCNQTSGQVISLHLLDTLLNSSLKTNSGLFRLQSLSHLLLRGCNLQGEIPSSLGNLTRLEALDLSDNHLVGEVPTSLGDLNKLRSLSLGSNSFFGPFPKSLFLNPSLEYVDLGGNQFTGPLEFVNSTSSSSKLQYLNLGDNRLDGPIPESISNFIHLRQLFINHNNFSGSIPRSISKLVKLRNIHLSNNMLKGEVPVLESLPKKPLTQMLDLSSNSFHGPLPHWICKLKQLRVLDLSNNLFNGSIPPCLRSSSGLLVDLILRNNSFSGVIPDIFADATKLQSFDVSRNHLEGSFPKSLINCKALQFVNVENNRIKDEFPFWLGSLSSIHVLILRSNLFYGPLYHPYMSIGFEGLRVMDISLNDFTGTLPPHYFSNWREMTTSSGESDQYYFTFIGYNAPWNIYGFISYESVYHSMEMVNKGVEMNFERILKDFRAIDFSGNRISGKNS